MPDRRRVFTGTPWEEEVGYCRAVRAGNLIFVTGTAPVTTEGGIFAPGDGYHQAKRCLEIIAGAMKQLDADLSHVVRTRMFVTDIERWKEFGRAHHEAFRAHPPTTSMIQVSRLIEPEMLIEIEADAVVP
jgi:isochorismate pyruvate lyase